MAERTRQLEIEDVERLLKVDELNLPKDHGILEIRVAEYIDSTEEDALDITIVFRDDAPNENLKWDRIRPIENAIRETLRGAGESRWPYFSIGRKTELEEVNGVPEQD